MLAIRRGETENILYFLIELDPQRALQLIQSKIHKQPGDWTPQLNLAAEDSWKRLLNSSIASEIRLELKQRADTDAIQVFRENLQNLLLAPPAGQIAVLGLDPGIRTGCKISVVDDTGKFLCHDVIYPFQPKNDVAGAERTLKALIAKYSVRAIAIGNGTASRETDAFVRDFLKNETFSSLFCVMVNESGASIYSASDIARQEFPDLDLTVRGAISIARRLQDPLAELVKLDPKSIGIGQYQHDVDQRHLHKSLETVIESCVNRVGVELNTASWSLLRYVAGINERTAQRIVEFRNENGRFRSRVQLNAVPGIGAKLRSSGRAKRSPVSLMESGARESGPAMVLRTSARSATERPRQPDVLSVNQPNEALGFGTRPIEGRKPATLQNAAGLRREPPVSEPSATGTSPEASATAAPPEDPPQVLVRS